MASPAERIIMLVLLFFQKSVFCLETVHYFLGCFFFGRLVFVFYDHPVKVPGAAEDAETGGGRLDTIAGPCPSRPAGRQRRGRWREVHAGTKAGADHGILRRARGEGGHRRAGGNIEADVLIGEADLAQGDGTRGVADIHPQQHRVLGGVGVPKAERDGGAG